MNFLKKKSESSGKKTPLICTNKILFSFFSRIRKHISLQSNHLFPVGQNTNNPLSNWNSKFQLKGWFMKSNLKNSPLCSLHTVLRHHVAVPRSVCGGQAQYVDWGLRKRPLFFCQQPMERPSRPRPRRCCTMAEMSSFSSKNYHIHFCHQNH